MHIIDQPHKLRPHADKLSAYTTPRAVNPYSQRRGTIWFPFEFYVAKGYLRANWTQKAILLEEYQEAERKAMEARNATT